MSRAYVYVVDRDFGFAPNPFHGFCTLATCKPGIRARAAVGDWIVGMGGTRLKATGRCVFAMKVTRKVTFDEYWSGPQFFDKRPVRNGSRRMLVGDNIYHRDRSGKRWIQADSHHSNSDGSVNPANVQRDTKSDQVLISECFYYFGKRAPTVPSALLASLGYTNGRNYRVFELPAASRLIAWLEASFGEVRNVLADDPFDFEGSEARYSVSSNKIS